MEVIIQIKDHGDCGVLLFSHRVEESVSVQFGSFGDGFFDYFQWVIPIKKMIAKLSYV